MSLDTTLLHIQDKDALKAWVDELPEGAKGLIILELPVSENGDEPGVTGWIRYHEVGRITIAETLYLTKSYEHWVFKDIQ